MKWMFELNGDINFLEELSKYFTSDEIFIFKEDKRYYLKSTCFNNIKYDYEARNKAEHLITLINGAAEFILYRKKPVKIYQVIEINNDGSTINERKYLLKKWVIASLKNDKIATLFEFICSDSNKWYLLYKRLELVQVDLGGETKLINKKWVPKNEIKYFKQTANCYKAIGAEARHYDNKIPPKKQMTYPDAKKLIDKINLKWLEGRSK